MDDLERLQRDIRDACPSGLWSRGVGFAREDKVELESRKESEIVFRIKVGRGVAPTVVLYPGDRDWECDCDSKFDACEHVAGAIIAFARSHAEGVAIAPVDPGGAGRLIYDFSRRRGQIALQRSVVGDDGKPIVLTRSIAAHLAGLASAKTPLQPDRADLEADAVLGLHPGDIIAEKIAHRLCAALAGNERARLDGVPIAIEAEPVAPVARVRKSGQGASLLVARSPLVDEVLSPGLALCGAAIRPLAATKLTGGRLEKLPLSRNFTVAELGELVEKVLPAIEREVAVSIDAEVELPNLDRQEAPRIDLGLRVEEGSVEVLPRLVYGAPPTARIDGDKLVHLRGDVPVRSRRGERELIEALRNELNLMCNRSVGFKGAEATAFLRLYRRSRFAENAEQVAAAVELVARVVVSGDRVVVRFEATDGAAASARDVLAAWDADNQIVPLAAGAFGRLPDGWLAGNAELVRELLAAEGSAIRALKPAAALVASHDLVLPPRLSALEPLVRDFTKLPLARLPADFSGELRPYQRVGVNWLGFLGTAELGGILADDMGLGKTVQVLATIRARRRSLVVAPTSTLPNWEREARRFRPSLGVAVYHGKDRDLEAAGELCITSYALLRLDIEKLAAIEWDAVILDEAQAIKNAASQAAIASRRLRARARIALSGTPIENRLEELWSISEFANPNLLGSESEFTAHTVKPIAAGDRSALEGLRARIRPVVLRRRKAEVAPELPPRIETIVYCELTEDERQLYDSVRAAARADIAKHVSGGGDALSALTALLRLRQAACHPALLPGRVAETSSKLERLVELLTEAVIGEHKALVFSQWTSLLDLVGPALTAAGIETIRLDGSTRDRGAVVDTFQRADGPPVMLISLKAGGTGLNLTAADHVFLLDPWWNPAAEEQAADRAHRIGQDKPVLIHRMVAADTVEERVLALKARKLALAESALGDVGAGAALSKEDLLALLG